MNESINLVCPNCGEALTQLPNTRRFNCPACKRELDVLSPKKVVIADPLSDFLVQDGTTDCVPTPPQFTNREKEISLQRRKRTTELTHERVTQEQIFNSRARWLGIWSMTLGVLSLGLGWLRQVYLRDDWLAIIMIAFGVIILVGGAFMTIQFYSTAKSLGKIKNDLEEKLNE